MNSIKYRMVMICVYFRCRCRRRPTRTSPGARSRGGRAAACAPRSSARCSRPRPAWRRMRSPRRASPCPTSRRPSAICSRRPPAPLRPSPPSRYRRLPFRLHPRLRPRLRLRTRHPHETRYMCIYMCVCALRTGRSCSNRRRCTSMWARRSTRR